METTSILWRRLDAPGHDACRLERTAVGWRLDGTAVFRHAGAAARLAYRVECDRGWLARLGEVQGWVGAARLDLRIARTDNGSWTVNGDLGLDASDCADLDLGFTPATNLIPLRRLSLRPGESADAPAAWLDVPGGALERLQQRYERRSESTYWYESPSAGYAAQLEVAPTGFVLRYPGLWEAEA